MPSLTPLYNTDLRVFSISYEKFGAGEKSVSLHLTRDVVYIFTKDLYRIN